MFNFGLTKYFLLLMIATAGATDAVQTNVEQLERNRLHKEHFYDALNAKILEQNMEDEDGKKRFQTSPYKTRILSADFRNRRSQS